MSSSLPPGWVAKESKSRPGQRYYFNLKSGETSWEFPSAADEFAVAKASVEQVQVLHILKKHEGSRRPSSWRVPTITQSKQQSVRQIEAIKEVIAAECTRGGVDAMVAKFKEIAAVESDCSSAQRGGDLGLFQRGQMQRSFEDASFKLAVFGLSGLVDSDSGIHIILRIA